MASHLTQMTPQSEWVDPGFVLHQSPVRNLLRVLRQLIKPLKGDKTLPTPTGLVLIALSIGIGSAAYNASSNILFITLSLMLSSLLLSGLLSWMNFKGTRWRMILPPHLRAGEVTDVRVELWNANSLLPVYSLCFNVMGMASRVSRTLYQQERLDPGEHAQLDWLFEPQTRGVETIAITSLESQFPFGFLRKSVWGGVHRSVVVWPKRVAYEFKPLDGHHWRQQGRPVLRPGSGTELINLRNYLPGDPVRLMHWKASARLRRPMVRDMSEDNQASYLIFVETPARVWPDPEQFEVLCSVAASLAEDLYEHDQLWGAAINDQPVLPIRRLSDLHRFLELLVQVQPVDHYTPVDDIMGTTVITFRPGAEKRVTMYVGGHQAGST